MGNLGLKRGLLYLPHQRLSSQGDTSQQKYNLPHLGYIQVTVLSSVCVFLGP